MTKKEEIILSTLDLASKYGLKSLSMSQIAESVGIKKPSLYPFLGFSTIKFKS